MSAKVRLPNGNRELIYSSLSKRASCILTYQEGQRWGRLAFGLAAERPLGSSLSLYPHTCGLSMFLH